MTHATMQRIFDATGKTPTEIAVALKTSPQNVNNWINRGISKSGAMGASSVFGLSVDWILKGQGEMTQSHLNPTTLDGYARIGDWDDNTPLDGDEVELTFYKELAFACGHGAEGEAMADEWRKLRFSRKTLEKLGVYRDKAFAATAQDDSMLPTICDGDTIFVDEGRNYIKDGRIFAIEHGGLFYCKRLYNLPNGGVRVVSDNADEFPEYSLSRDDIEKDGFRVIGWVFSVSRLERW